MQRLAVLLFALVLVAVACQTATEIGQRSTPASTDASTRNAEASEQVETVAAAEPTKPAEKPNEVPEAEAPMSTPSEVFERARQSVVFVGSPLDGQGSGVAIEGGWIVTNAHVVGRASAVRIVSSDGAELGEVPVHAVDPVVDIALLGPIDIPELAPIPIEQAVSADVLVGETVYLLGYPDETNTLPVPTLTEGIVNRRRQVVLRDYTFLQVDASIAPGQSGGALLDTEGRLIGISGIRFGAAAFGLALDTDSLAQRVDLLLEAEPVADPYDGEPLTSIEEVLGPQRYVAFMVESDGEIEVEVSSSGDTFIELLTAAGSQKFEDWQDWDFFVDLPRRVSDYFVDRTSQGTERMKVAIEPGRYQLLIGSIDVSPAPATITSGTPLFALDDSEEGAVLPPGEVVEGEFGWTKDSDKWQVPLVAGDEAVVTIDGIGDFFGVVRFDGAVVASNDDAGFGVFGLGATIEFTAASDGVYELEIGTRDIDRHGYFVKLDVS